MRDKGSLMADNLLADTASVPPGDAHVPPPETATAREAAVPLSNSSNWWRVADAFVLLVWVCITNFTLRYHEKWADEAQAWLIARDLPLRTIWFHELRYEGTPGLWHTILWIAQHVFHAGYGAIGYIGLAGATAGAALLIFKAPFPRYIRWPLAFTYFMVYQYAVIARPYTLLPLLAFAAAMLFKDIQHPERMTVVLVLLANLSLHGTIIAGCIGFCYLLEAVQSWRNLDQPLRNRYIISVTMMMLMFVFLFVILKPTPDVGELHQRNDLSLLGPMPTAAQKLVAGVCGSFLDYPVPSFLFLALAGAWCFSRERFLTFALPVALMAALFAAVHGYAHHHGTMFVAAIAGLWISWPTLKEKAAFSQRAHWALDGMTAALLYLCFINIWDAEVTIRREYKYPYSGAEDAANYLKSVGADRAPIFGYLYGVVGVQAYFDHNIFANTPRAYFHQGTPFVGDKIDAEELARTNPEYLVVYSAVPQVMLDTDGPTWRSLGYEIVHFSDGYYLFKRGVYQREAYFIFRRTRASTSQISP
jgi:hypothetical protein